MAKLEYCTLFIPCQTRLLIVTWSSRRPKVVTCLSIKKTLHWDTSILSMATRKTMQFKSLSTDYGRRWRTFPIRFFLAFTVVWAFAFRSLYNNCCFARSRLPCISTVRIESVLPLFQYVAHTLTAHSSTSRCEHSPLDW